VKEHPSALKFLPEQPNIPTSQNDDFHEERLAKNLFLAFPNTTCISSLTIHSICR
jgi:hypothetical protein